MIGLWAKIFKLVHQRNQLSSTIRAELSRRCLSPIEKYFKDSEDEYELQAKEAREKDK